MGMVAFLPKVTAETWGRPGGKHPERQSCKESHRCGGQASDQAQTSEFQVGHQAWPADMSAPRAPTAGPGGGWVMSAMLETSPSLQGEGVPRSQRAPEKILPGIGPTGSPLRAGQAVHLPTYPLP